MFVIVLNEYLRIDDKCLIKNLSYVQEFVLSHSFLMEYLQIQIVPQILMKRQHQLWVNESIEDETVDDRSSIKKIVFNK